MTSEGQRPSAASKTALFDLEDDLKKTWATFTESSDEKCFRKFVRGLVSSWEKSNSWDDLMTSSLHGGCVKLQCLLRVVGDDDRLRAHRATAP